MSCGSSAIWAAISRAAEDGKLVAVPPRISNDRWGPHLPNRELVLTLDELAVLFNAADDDEKRTSRYSREHWWRYLVLAIGTAARPEAILELDYSQADFRTHTLTEPSRA